MTADVVLFWILMARMALFIYCWYLSLNDKIERVISFLSGPFSATMFPHSFEVKSAHASSLYDWESIVLYSWGFSAEHWWTSSIGDPNLLTGFLNVKQKNMFRVFIRQCNYKKSSCKHSCTFTPSEFFSAGQNMCWEISGGRGRSYDLALVVTYRK